MSAARRRPTQDTQGDHVRNRLSFIPLLLAAMLAFVAVPAGASADYRKIYGECANGAITGKYTPQELQKALQNLGSLGDYNDCSDVISRALTGGGGKKSGSGGGENGGKVGTGRSGPGTGGSTGSGTAAGTPGGTGTTTGATGADAGSIGAASKATQQQGTEAAAIAAAAATKGQADSDMALKSVKVPESSLDLGSSGASLPLPLLLALIACGGAACLAGAATGVQALRRRRAR